MAKYSSQGYEIEIDLYNDYIDQIKGYLRSTGYPIGDNEESFDIFIKFINFRKRRIDPKPRKVFISKELQCHKEHLGAFMKLKEKIERGENLTPYLSKGIKRLESYDKLLNDWGIHHLHLGSVWETESEISRTGPLLFAKVNEDAFYMIDIKEHGSWVDIDLIEIIHNNWPGLLSPFKMSGITGPNISQETRKLLRQDNATTTIEVSDGAVYMPPGGGLTTAGSSLFDTIFHDQYRHALKECEKAIIDNITRLALEAGKQGKLFGKKLHFKLDLTKAELTVVEVKSGASFQFPDYTVRM
ncbi:MAG: hypothetical protein QXZ09_03680 [Candidatus Methanomethylicaceae archaeon]